MLRRNLQRITALVSVLGLLAAGCAYMSLGMVCPPDGGDCVPGIQVYGYICTNGRPVPDPAMCPEMQEPLVPGGGSIPQFRLKYSANYPMSMSSLSPSGVLLLYKNGALSSSISVGFTTVGTTQTVSNVQQLLNNVEAAMTSSTAQYTYRLKPPSIRVTSTAPLNATVALTGKLQEDGYTVAQKTMLYEAGADGGPKKVNQGYGGGN